jgi:hypothetical protein
MHARARLVLYSTILYIYILYIFSVLRYIIYKYIIFSTKTSFELVLVKALRPFGTAGQAGIEYKK